MILEALPCTITAQGRAFPIDTDFRTWMRFEQLLQEDVPADWMVDAAFQLCFPEHVPQAQIAEAFAELLRFYACGETDDRPRRRKKRPKRLYDYDRDSRALYAAFRAQYGIALDRAALHWWEFRALFESLSDDNLLVKIIGYRAMDIGKIKNREERRRYAELQAVYRLPDAAEKGGAIQNAGTIFSAGMKGMIINGGWAHHD